MTKNEIKKPTVAQKVGIIIGVIIIIFVGYFIGSLFDALLGIYGISLVGALIAARIGSKMLKNRGVVAADSVWAKENKALKIAKYLVLTIVLMLLLYVFIYLI